MSDAEFLSNDLLRECAAIISETSEITVSPDQFQEVGFNIGPREITDFSGHLVEPLQGYWSLRKGTYVMKFGIRLPILHLVSNGSDVQLIPSLNERSSGNRLGMHGNYYYSDSTQNEFLPPPYHLYGGELCGIFSVFNPHGVSIEEGAWIAQLSYHLPGHSLVSSRLFHPEIIHRYGNQGRIGVGIRNTQAPVYEEVKPNEIGVWELQAGEPYMMRFSERVRLGTNEILVHTIHQADYSLDPNLFDFGFYADALVDSGYYGTIGGIFVPRKLLQLTRSQGITRFTRHNVLPGNLKSYDGQWQDPQELDHALIEYGHATKLGLVGVTNP